jgi:hypothetical protein
MAAAGEDLACQREVFLKALQDNDFVSHLLDLAFEEFGGPFGCMSATFTGLFQTENLLDFVEGKARRAQVGDQQKLIELSTREEAVPTVTALGGMQDIFFFVEANGS